MAELADALNELASQGCTDGYCDFRGPAKGMHTNGGCRCLGDIRNPNVRVRVRAVLRAARALSDATSDGCPCTIIDPCGDNCSCANPVMSGGCRRCAKYGSQEQRIAGAVQIANAVDGLEAAAKISRLYFEIAEEVLGEDEVRRRFKERMDKLLKEKSP